jgi:hypothetical protein
MTTETPCKDAYRAAVTAARAAWDAYCNDEPADEESEACRAAFAADEVVIDAHNAWCASDELRDYVIRDDNASWNIQSRPSTLDADVEKSVRDGDWETEETWWWRGRAFGEDGTETKVGPIEMSPDEPACRRGREHDWQAPHSVVGGIRDNPGVWGHGGGVKIHEVCAICGAHRHTNTWAQDPVTGEQGLRSVSYEPADDDSLAWVASEKETP